MLPFDFKFLVFINPASGPGKAKKNMARSKKIFVNSRVYV